MNKIPYVKIFIFGGYFAVPFTAAMLYFLTQNKTTSELFYSVFIIVHSIERIWETFYTTKERKASEMQGDWTLVMVTIAYFILGLFCLFEFYFLRIQTSFAAVFAGSSLYIFAFALRWWGMTALGSQWAIHAVGVQKIKKIRVTRAGPYKYIRHPIYLAILMEVLSLPIIGGLWFSALFAFFVNIPLQLYRLKIEEINSIRRFGENYAKYQQEVDALLPFKFLKRILTSG